MTVINVAYNDNYFKYLEILMIKKRLINAINSTEANHNTRTTLTKDLTLERILYLQKQIKNNNKKPRTLSSSFVLQNT